MNNHSAHIPLFQHNFWEVLPHYFVAPYLQDIFKDVLPMIVNAIQNDMCIIPFWEMMQSKMDLNKEIIQLKKEEHKLKNDIKDLQNNKDFLENSLIQAKQKLSTMAKMMLNAV